MVGAGCGRVGFEIDQDGGSGGEGGADAFEPRICARYPQAIYCNDFEDGLGGVDNNGGMFVAMGGFGGSAGVRFVADGGQMPGVTHDITPVTAGTLRFGARAKVESGAFVDDYLVLAQATTAAFEKVSFDLVDNDSPQVVNSIMSGGGLRAPFGTFPRGRWFCFEVVIEIASASVDGVTLFIDEQQAVHGWQGESTQPTGGFTRMELAAYASSANSAPITVTFDNWIVQTAPIGCQ